MKKTFLKIFTLLIIVIFICFSVIWIYDAWTAPQDSSFSMFYIHQSQSYTQKYPQWLGLVLPVVLSIATIVLSRFGQHRLGMGVSLFILCAMSIYSANGLVYWNNPFQRSNNVPSRIDYAFGTFLYISLLIDIVFLIYLLIVHFSEELPYRTVDTHL